MFDPLLLLSNGLKCYLFIKVWSSNIFHVLINVDLLINIQHKTQYNIITSCFYTLISIANLYLIMIY